MTRRREWTSPPGVVFRMGVFVPAIMSVGMAFWLVTLVRDAFRWRSNEAEQRRATAAGRRVAGRIDLAGRLGDPDLRGLRPRGNYLVVVLVLVALVVYVAVGSIANYQRPGGYVEHQGWLLAVAVIAAGIGTALAAAAFHTWQAWPSRRIWVKSVVTRTPLSCLPPDKMQPGRRPDWRLSAALFILPVCALIVTFLVVTEWAFVGWIDRRSRQLLDFTETAELSFLDPIGSTPVGIVLAGLIGVSALRCRPLAFAYPATVLGGLAVSHFGKSIIDRARPPDGSYAGSFDSFPSGHLIQATLIAGLLPLALAVLVDNRRVIWPARIILGVGVVAASLYRIDEGIHWPTDIAASLLIGASLVMLAQWVIDHEAWHAWCRDCVWTSGSIPHRQLGAIPLRIHWDRVLSGIAHAWAAGSVLLLTYLSLTRGIPSNPDGIGLGPAVQEPVQLSLAGLASIAAVLSWRWPAAGAVMLALAGTGLGIFSALEYEATQSVVLAALFIVPSVLLWVSWQHKRSIVEILVLATVTLGLLTATWVGASALHDELFGPTHPDSAAATRPVEEVEWLWMGALRDTGVDVVAGVGGEGRTARLLASAPGSDQVVAGSSAHSGPDGSVRMSLAGLQPDTHYVVRVEVDGIVDDSRGRGDFRTAPSGPASFRFVASSCARTGSNGAVFDAIAAEDPLFYLGLGDVHYQNLDVTTPGPYRDAYRRLLTKPGQAELYRSVPVAYVWDDHDFGPNDSDASAPGRSVARQTYREIVPHYPLVESGDAPIHQAFTIGRVRFVLTDSRSERTDASMLGDAQRDWLISELVESSRTHALVVWGNPVPWISESSDGWGGWPGERTEIADALVAAEVENLVMLSGDAHMVALDDGSNSDFSTSGGGGFPVFHAAPLDRPGNVKGGPYSEGAFAGSGQYGLVEVIDEGADEISVVLTGRTWEGETLLSRTFSFPVDSVAAAGR